MLTVWVKIYDREVQTVLSDSYLLKRGRRRIQSPIFVYYFLAFTLRCA